MNWPTSQDYNEAVQDAANSYSDPALKRGEVVTNALGLPVPRSGNFADVYQFKDGDGKMWALKCFTRKVPGLRERYAKIDEHLGRAKLPFTVGFKFMEQGIQVKGEWFPLLKMEWVEGFTLNDFVAENINKPQYLHALMQMWAKLAGRLRDANMAHADLQHGNVLLVPGATPQKLGLKLIDYDGMWVPALSDYHSGEVGHPNYQHPMRLKDKLYNGDVDRFPHLVVAAGLRATVVGGKAIWDRFDNGDNLLFKESDLRDPANVKVFKALWELNDPVLRTLVGHIALSSKEPMRKTPWLDDILFEESGPKLTGDQEKRVCEMLGVSSAAPAVKSAAQAKVEQEFNVFEFLDDDDSEPAGPSAKSETRRSPSKMVKRSKKEEKKSKLPLFIGGGAVAAVLLIGGIVAAVSLGGKKDRPTELVQKKEDDLPKPPDEGGPKPPKKQVETDQAALREELKQAIGGTRWNWFDGMLELRADGTTSHARWENQFRLTTNWEPLDRRTALLIVEKGRPHNRYAVLEFSEDLGQLTAFDFGGTQRTPPRPRVGPLSKPIFGTKAHDTKQDLHRELAGSEWEWNNGRLILQPDGVANLPLDGAADLLVRWEAIDRRTAIVAIERGRTTNRLAVLQFSEDLSELRGYDFENAARLTPRKRLEKGAAPPPVGSDKGAIGVAALPNGREFLLIRRGDPALYMSDNQSGDQSGLKARPIGRHNNPIRAVAAASDGSRAITGGEDGEIRIWNLKESPEKKGEELGASLGKFKKIELFKERFSFDAYEEGIVVHDHEKNQDATIRVGKTGHPVKGAFKSNLNNPDNAKRFGEALTDEVKVFDGELIVQVFEGGAQFLYPTVNKSWFGWHRKRQPDPKGIPSSPKALKEKVLDPKKMQGMVGDYEYTVYREGLLIHDKKTGKESTVFAGSRPAKIEGIFKGQIESPKSQFRDPVSEPMDVFDGALTVQLFRDGFLAWEKQSKHTWTHSATGLFKEEAPAASAPKPLKTKVSGPAKFDGFNRNYEVTLYREGILIRDIDANKEETLHAGTPVAEKDGKFEGSFAFEKLSRSYGPPVTVPTKLFGGDIEIVLCKRGFFVNQVGTARDWNWFGAQDLFDEPGPAKDAPPAKEPKRADFVWLDDALPAGAKQQFPPYPEDIPWEFVGKNEGQVHSGEKSVKLTASGCKQYTAFDAKPGLRVGKDDVLFAHVYLDLKDPPEQIMFQWHTTAWMQFGYWGADKVRNGNKGQKRLGDLPETGKWVRLEMKAEDLGIKDGMIINGLALTQFGGTVYWDTIGVNTQTPQEGARPDAPKAPIMVQACRSCVA